ncbi:hypothetical protein R6Q57_011841 [Mikania cordata]
MIMIIIRARGVGIGMRRGAQNRSGPGREYQAPGNGVGDFGESSPNEAKRGEGRKRPLARPLRHYFDLAQYHNTECWDGIKLGIQADCANRYKDWKTKLKKHFDKEGGYDSIARAKQNPPKGVDPEEWVQVIDGLFTTSTYKNKSLKNTTNRSKQLYGSYHGTQSYAQRRYDEENITDELNKAKSTSSGDDTPVDEMEVLQRSLGQRRGHVRGVGEKLKV